MESIGTNNKMISILNYLLNKRWILNIVIIFLSDEKKEKIYIERLRAEFGFFGHDISNMTDDEIIAGVEYASKVIPKCGLTLDEVMKFSHTMAKII